MNLHGKESDMTEIIIPNMEEDQRDVLCRGMDIRVNSRWLYNIKNK